MLGIASEMRPIGHFRNGIGAPGREIAEPALNIGAADGI
jgi:hypothetical protein